MAENGFYESGRYAECLLWELGDILHRKPIFHKSLKNSLNTMKKEFDFEPIDAFYFDLIIAFCDKKRSEIKNTIKTIDSVVDAVIYPETLLVDWNDLALYKDFLSFMKGVSMDVPTPINLVRAL
jgi:hypothetical protein